MDKVKLFFLGIDKGARVVAGSLSLTVMCIVMGIVVPFGVLYEVLSRDQNPFYQASNFPFRYGWTDGVKKFWDVMRGR